VTVLLTPRATETELLLAEIERLHMIIRGAERALFNCPVRDMVRDEIARWEAVS
jgi:hypothetical protein